MRFARKLASTVSVVVLIQLCGCAATYHITSDPNGASVELSSGHNGRTPATFKVSDGLFVGDLLCIVNKDGWMGQSRRLPGSGGAFHFVLMDSFSDLLPRLSLVMRRPTYELEFKSQIDKEVGEDLTCSIGDVLFRIERYTLGDEILAVLPPRGLSPFPKKPTWEGTHTYNGPDGNDLIVYTHKDYHSGRIGVILDRNGIMATKDPYIRVIGGAADRWSEERLVPFFKRKRTSIEVWGLIYGGKRDENYQFEVIDQVNPKEIEIVQEIMISPKEFSSGFIVKGVLVRGVSESELGLLTYTVKDVLVNN